MGYRSDIRIVTSKKGYEVLKEFVKKYLEEKDLDTKEYNLLECLEVKAEDKEQIYFGWNSIKWYDGCEGYEDVDAIVQGIDHLGENEIGRAHV